MIDHHHPNLDPNAPFHHANSPSTFPTRNKRASGRPLCRSSTHRCPESQRTSLPWTPSQFQVPPCGFRNRSGRPLERGSSLIHHQPRPSQNTRHPSTVAPGRHRRPHLQMDRFPHTCGIDSICSHPHFRRPNPPSQPRGRTPHLQWPPCTTPPWPRSLQPPPPPPPLTCQWTLPLDFAHLESGQYKNSPNAWKLPSKTAHWDPIAAKRREGKKKNQKSRGLKTHPCRTPPSEDLLQPLLPTICRCWSRYKCWIIQIICSERPCSERARHSAGQCTRSKAFDKSRLTIQIGTFALESLSKTKCVVTRCSSTRLPPRKPCCSSGWCASSWVSTRPKIMYAKSL